METIGYSMWEEELVTLKTFMISHRLQSHREPSGLGTSTALTMKLTITDLKHNIARNALAGLRY